MRRAVAALALAGIAGSVAPVHGADDVAQLALVHPRDILTYSLELDGPDHLVGPLETGKVDLKKANGVWSGWLGFDLLLQAGTADPTGDGEIRVTLRSVHWPERRQYVVRLTGEGDVEVTGRGPWAGAQDTHSFLSADATTLTQGHCGRDVRLNSCLRFTSEVGRSYDGQYDGIQNVNSPRYQLEADGHLTPAATAREDPVLYVLLYVLLAGGCPSSC